MAGGRPIPQTPAPTGPAWADVISLLHFNGVDGSTTYTDEKGKAWTKIGTGTAALSTTQKKFGSAALRLTGGGTTAGLRESVSSDVFSFMQNTIELFFFLDSVSATDQVVISNAYAPSDYDWNIAVSTTGISARAGAGSIYSITPGGVVSASTWYHAALVRDGATMKLYLNGVLIGSCPFLSSTSSGGFISIGHASNGGQKAFGYFDDVRITKTAVYTGDFTPSVAEFPNS